MDVISLQSRVKSGYVGNAVAVPVLNATGATARPVDSVVYAHHPGHGPVTPSVTPLGELSARLEDTLTQCAKPAVFLSGYLANAAQGRATLEFLVRARTAGRIQDYHLDPVFGDDAEGTYVDPSLVGFFRDEAIPQCTVLLPNRYELSVLGDTPVDTVADAMRTAVSLMQRGPKIVLASSIPAAGSRLANVLVTEQGGFVTETPKLPLRAKGTGDMLSAAFTGLFSDGMDASRAMALSVAVVDETAAAASAANASELDLSNVLEVLNLKRAQAASVQPIESLE